MSTWLAIASSATSSRSMTFHPWISFLQIGSYIHVIPTTKKKRNVHKHWKGTQSTVGKTLVQMVNRSIVKRKNGEVPSFILRPLRAKGRHCFYSCCCFQTNRNTTTTKSSWPWVWEKEKKVRQKVDNKNTIITIFWTKNHFLHVFTFLLITKYSSIFWNEN